MISCRCCGSSDRFQLHPSFPGAGWQCVDGAACVARAAAPLVTAKWPGFGGHMTQMPDTLPPPPLLKVGDKITAPCKKCKNGTKRVVIQRPDATDSTDQIIFCKLCGQEEALPR